MEPDFKNMEASARKMAARVNRAETKAAKAAAKKAGADRLAALAAQRGMAGPAATQMLGRLFGAAGIVITGAEIARAIRESKRTEKERVVRGTRIARDAEARSVKPKRGQSPTDAMRANMTGRVTTGTAANPQKPAAKKAVSTLRPAAKPSTSKPAAKKPSGNGFSQAFKEARAKFDAGTGNTTFKFNGSSYSVAKPAELKAAGGTYGKKLNDMLKSKQRRSETDKQVTNKPKSKSKFAGMPNEKMLNRLEREKTAKKSYGGSMSKKTVKKKIGGKIGRGCGAATRGGGAVMK